MKTTVKEPGDLSNKTGIPGIGLCAVACSLPIIGGVIGVGILTFNGFILEKATWTALMVLIGILAAWEIVKKKKKLFAGMFAILLLRHLVVVKGGKKQSRFSILK